jgi:lipoprotein-anchoring transpeptidase ErfK/SrfK
LTEKGYGLHGPHKQGDKAEGGGFENEGFISHGCLRFTEDDILRVGEYLDVGSSVEILPYDTRPLHRGALRIK